jgi:hypothetical protein
MLRRSALAMLLLSAARPSEALAATLDRLRMTSVALYSPSFVWDRDGPGPEALSGYIKALVGAGNRGLIGQKPIDASGALVIALKPPARSRAWIVAGDPVQQAALTAALRAHLEMVKPPPVRGVLALAVNFDCDRGGPQPERFQGAMALPSDWKAALSAHGGRIPDDALAVVWPN